MNQRYPNEMTRDEVDKMFADAEEFIPTEIQKNIYPEKIMAGDLVIIKIKQ